MGAVNAGAQRQAAPGTLVTDTFRAPLLEAVLGRLRPTDRWLVLDLGQISSATVSFFRHSRCWLGVADLSDDILALNPAAAELADAVEALLPTPTRGERIDLVLGWELCNFLPPAVLGALMQALGKHCAPGAFFHFLLGYTSGSVPATPARYGILSNATLKRFCVAEKRPGAPPALLDIEKEAPACHLVRSMLLRNGLQECLLQWRGGPPPVGKPRLDA